MFEIITKQRPPTPEVRNVDTNGDTSPENVPIPA